MFVQFTQNPGSKRILTNTPKAGFGSNKYYLSNALGRLGCIDCEDPEKML